MTILALRGWRSGLVGRADRGREALRLRLRLSRVPLARAGLLLLLRDRDCEASRGVTERAWDLERALSSAVGVGERARDGLRLSDMMVVEVGAVL
jgi:hypothetical protein